MSKVNIPDPSENERKLLEGVNAQARFIDYGTGAPTHSPTGPALYFRFDLAAGAAIYGWDGTSWTALV